jgi:hypothetical protein
LLTVVRSCAILGVGVGVVVVVVDDDDDDDDDVDTDDEHGGFMTDEHRSCTSSRADWNVFTVA